MGHLQITVQFVTRVMAHLFILLARLFFYSTIGANETTRRDRERETLENCRAAGNSDCNLLGSWQNSCATVAKLTNANGVHPLFATGDNTRVSRREVRRLCKSMDPDGVCDIRRSHCIRPYVQLVPY